jgi:DNA-binding transcriptional MerR regulator
MDERLIVRPRILDHKRMYSRRDVARLALITALRNKGQNLQEARMAAMELHDQITAGDVIVKVKDSWRVFSDSNAAFSAAVAAAGPVVMVRVEWPNQ